MTKSLRAILPLLALVHGCGGPSTDSFEQRAGELSRELLIVDTHIDLPYRLHRNWQDVSKATEDGDIDYPRARAGGLDAPFMSIYIPPKVDAEGGAVALADELIDSMERIIDEAPDKFALATCADDFMAIKASGRIVLMLRPPKAGPIDRGIA
ncbi:MAG: membrane dipeptidase, partial [Gammaproteobacteria bacterium]|nr:membrane dipeptidase [Gammaproteobacteria bacterium]